MRRALAFSSTPEEYDVLSIFEGEPNNENLPDRHGRRLPEVPRVQGVSREGVVGRVCRAAVAQGRCHDRAYGFTNAIAAWTTKTATPRSPRSPSRRKGPRDSCRS